MSIHPAHMLGPRNPTDTEWAALRAAAPGRICAAPAEHRRPVGPQPRMTRVGRTAAGRVFDRWPDEERLLNVMLILRDEREADVLTAARLAALLPALAERIEPQPMRRGRPLATHDGGLAVTLARLDAEGLATPAVCRWVTHYGDIEDLRAIGAGTPEPWVYAAARARRAMRAAD